MPIVVAHHCKLLFLSHTSTTLQHHQQNTHAQRPATGAIIDSQGYSKAAHADSGEESPLSPPMAWSREGTSEELSKYQEFQMRQNDGHHHRSQAQPHSSPPGAGATVFSTPPNVDNNTTITVQDQDRRSHLVANSQSTGPGSFSEAVRGSHTDQTQTNTTGGRLRTEQSRRSDRLEPASEPPSTKTSRRDSSSERTLDSPHSTRQRPSPSSSPSTRHLKSGRSKTKSKGHDDGSQHGLDLSTSPAAVTRSERTGTTPGSPHCQRYRLSGSTTKKGYCACSSCQQEGSILTPSQRSYRYGQYLGSDPIPIYAGPLGLGDDIPSPTPSPPTSGRMSIHMAMSGHSPIGSPVHSPALSLSHSPMGKSSPSFLRSPGSSKSKSSRHPVTEGFSGSGEFGLHDEQHGIDSDAISNPPTSHHPVITGFQTRELKAKNSKKSPSSTTAQSVLEPNPYSSPSSPPSFPSSCTNFNSHTDKGKDTSPSLSPFSPPRHTTHSTGASSLKPMVTETLQAHHLLRQNASTSHQGDLSTTTAISHADFPRLAPPVVLVQSPTAESLTSLVEKVSRSTPPGNKQSIERSPLLYSSVLASSTSPNTSASSSFSHAPRSPSQQPLSPRGRQSAAATPPLSPSRKKEGHHHSVLSNMESTGKTKGQDDPVTAIFFCN